VVVTEKGKSILIIFPFYPFSADEATASIDFATDEAIQSTIRTGFKDACVLTIAHRISSVIDYDRLLILAGGEIAEFDTPINLLRKDDSVFKVSLGGWIERAAT
jgi:ABC-type multidrug transport system fused ATPase/permease subunit